MAHVCLIVTLLDNENKEGASKVNVQPGWEVPVHLRELYQTSKTALNASDSEKLAQLLSEYSYVFWTGPGDLGRTTLVTHDIKLKSEQPIKQKARRMAELKQQGADKQIRDGCERNYHGQ